MSISKLMLLSQTPSASDVDASAAAASRRGNSNSEDEADAPSFDDALEESRSQYTQAPTPAPDATAVKPSKQKNSDDQSGDTDGAQSATTEDTPPGQKPAETKADSTDDTDSKPATTNPAAKDHSNDKTVDPSTLVIPNSAAMLLQTFVARSSAGPGGGKHTTSKTAAVAKSQSGISANLRTDQPQDKAQKADQAATTKAGTQADASAVANDSQQSDGLAGQSRKEHQAAKAAANAPANPDDAKNQPVGSAATANAVAADTAAGSAVQTQAQAQANLPVKVDIISGDQPLPLGVAPAPTSSLTSAQVAHAAQDSHAASTADPMDQIVLGLKSKMDPRTGKAEIRLDPPNLGALKVSLSLQNGSLTAQFESASPMVRDLLKNNLGHLKTVLESQGVAVDRLAVEPPADTQSQGQSSSFGSASHDGRSAGQYQQDPRQQRGSPDAEAFAGLFSKAQEAPLDLVA